MVRPGVALGSNERPPGAWSRHMVTFFDLLCLRIVRSWLGEGLHCAPGGRLLLRLSLDVNTGVSE